MESQLAMLAEFTNAMSNLDDVAAVFERAGFKVRRFTGEVSIYEISPAPLGVTETLVMTISSGKR
jgi:hypothetical protein